MNREIKFRVWDRELKRLLYSDEIDAEFLGEILQGKYPEMVIMQYIGLKDKNKVDIYEGDIIMRSRYDRRAVVKYGKAGFIALRVEKTYKNIPGDGGHEAECIYYGDSMCEVIGNIYENPELLTNNN